MGVDSALKFSYGFLFLIGFCHAAVLKSNSDRDKTVLLLPDQICPCVVYSECPRVFGSRPEDDLLGAFPPCEVFDAVRCCGVSTRVSSGHSVSSNLPNPQDPSEEKIAEDPGLPSDVVVPVPFEFPVYVDPRTKNVPLKYGEKVMENYQNNHDDNEEGRYFEESKSEASKNLMGENIDENISQADGFLAPDHLDYSTVNKYGIELGEAQTITGSGQLGGKISLNKRIESNPPSSNDMKNERVRTDENGSSSARRNLSGNRFIDLKSGFRGRKMFKDFQDASSQQRNEKVTKETSNFEGSKSSSTNLANPEETDIEILRTTVGNQEPEVDTGFRGRSGYGSRTRFSNQQRSDKSVTKESKNVEENTSSDSQSIATNNGEPSHTDTSSELLETSWSPVSQIRRPITNRGSIVYGERTETSSWQDSSSLKKESPNFEENTSSNVQTVDTNTEELLDDHSSLELVVTTQRPVQRGRRPISNRGNTAAYGQRKEISSEQESSSVKEESSNFEENSTFNSQRTNTNTGDLPDNDVNAEMIVTTRRPVSEVRRPTPNKGSPVYGERKETSSRQESNSVKEESSNFEVNSTFDSQRTNTNAEDLSDDDADVEMNVTTRRPVSEVRRPIPNRSSPVYGERKETSSRQESNSVKEESSDFKENSSFNSRRTNTNTGGLSDDDADAEMIVTTRRPVSEVRRPTPNRGSPVYGKRKETSSRQESSSTKTESSKFEENSSSNSRRTNANAGSLPDDDADEEMIVTTRRPVSEIRRPTPSKGGRVYGERKETSSRQESSSTKTESSKFEGNSSSNSRRTNTNTGDFSNDDSGAELTVTTWRPVAKFRRPTSNGGSSVYGDRKGSFSRQETSFVKKESSKYEENPSSNVQNIAMNSRDLSHDDTSSRLTDPSSIDTAVFEERTKSSTSEELKKVKEESSSFEKKTSSTVENASSKTEELSHDDKVTEENSSSNVNHLTVTDETTSDIESKESMNEKDLEESSIINRGTFSSSIPKADRVSEIRTDSSTKRRDETVSSESSNSRTESTTTSNIWKISRPGKQLPEFEVISKPTEPRRTNNPTQDVNQRKDAMVWHVANRTYVPVLINAGFLKDHSSLTGPVGPDPVSGVTQTDIWDNNLAPELLPLSCGNVVFGERFEDGKTLVCNIPQDHVLPIRFMESNKMTISNEKLDGPILPGAIMPGSGSATVKGGIIKSMTENRREQNSMTTNSRLSESRGDESSRTSKVDATKNGRQHPRRKGFFYRRPIQVPVVVPRPTRKAYRGSVRYPVLVRRVNTVEDDKESVGSKRFAEESVSTSSSSSLTSRFSQESVSSGSNEKITKSDFDVSSTHEYNAEKETEQRKSKLYLLPVAPILPHPHQDSPKVAEDRVDYARRNGKPEFGKIVEVVEEAPMTRTKVSKKISRNYSSAKKPPAKELEVVRFKTSEDNGARVEEKEFVVFPADDDFGRRTAFNNWNHRQAKKFAPEEERLMISPEELSQPGRIPVIGPIPSGYKDPALFTEEELAIDLPASSKNHDSQFSKDVGKQTDANGVDKFKPSPVDPINWP